MIISDWITAFFLGFAVACFIAMAIAHRIERKALQHVIASKQRRIDALTYENERSRV